MNPFIELMRNGLGAVTAFAWLLAYAGVSIWLLGLAWEVTTDLRNYVEHRTTANKYGPQWSLVPPAAVYLRAGAVCLLASVNLFLVLAGGWLLAGGWTTFV
jgi:hypothetical protein